MCCAAHQPTPLIPTPSLPSRVATLVAYRQLLRGCHVEQNVSECCRYTVSVVAVVWQFDVRRGTEAEFERFYGADGEWTKLSRRSRSFLGSSFLRDIAVDGRYLL